jgi:hypothetical protein
VLARQNLLLAEMAGISEIINSACGAAIKLRVTNGVRVFKVSQKVEYGTRMDDSNNCNMNGQHKGIRKYRT